MIGPRLAEAAITAVEKPRPYFFLSSGPSVEESAAASETAVPETSERIAPASIATCGGPPPTRRTSAFEKAPICAMMPPLIISSPATMNSGIAISGNELTAAIMRCGSMLKSTFDSHSPPMAAAPSANASGMPSSPAARKNAITHQLMRASFDHLNGAHRLAPEELDEVQEAERGGAHPGGRGAVPPAGEPVHRVEDAGVELLQVLLLGVGDHPVDEVGADALLHVLDDTGRALAHLLAELRRHLVVGHAALLDLGDRLAFLGRGARALPGDRFRHAVAQHFLLRRRQGFEGFAVGDDVDEVEEVRGVGHELLHLEVAAGVDHGERVLLAVDDALLQRRVELLDVHGHGVRAERAEGGEVGLVRLHADLQALQVPPPLDPPLPVAALAPP